MIALLLLGWLALFPLSCFGAEWVLRKTGTL